MCVLYWLLVARLDRGRFDIASGPQWFYDVMQLVYVKSLRLLLALHSRIQRCTYFKVLYQHTKYKSAKFGTDSKVEKKSSKFATAKIAFNGIISRQLYVVYDIILFVSERSRRSVAVAPSSRRDWK